MTKRRKIILGTLAFVAVAGGSAWYWQSHLVGLGARWYLSRIAAREDAAGDLTQRRETVSKVHRMLLIAPPSDVLVPELFDFLTAISSRVSTGEIDLNWAAYVYNSYERDLERDRPDGVPRATQDSIDAKVAEYVYFYTLQKRPDQAAPGDQALTGGDDDSLTVEEIEEAHRNGRDPTKK